jgi:hypothetical protein
MGLPQRNATDPELADRILEDAAPGHGQNTRFWTSRTGTLAKNDAWVQAANDKDAKVYLALPQTAANLFDAIADRPTVFPRELDQWLDPGEAFRGVHPYATKAIVDSLEKFLARSQEDRTIEAMGYRASSDPDGFRYERTW